MLVINCKMKKTTIFFSLLLCWTFCSAQLSAEAISVSVTLDHADWRYQTGQNALFTIEVQRGGKSLKNLPAHLEIGPEKMQPALSKDTLLKDRLIFNGGALHQPGFLRCIATVEIEGKKYRGLATAAYATDSIKPTAKQPKDFETFWTDAIASARKIPLDAKLNLIKEGSGKDVNVYEVSFQNNRVNSRMYGILCVPKKEGKYPALLKVPGAGIRPYRGDTALAEKGIVTLEIGVHGIPVTQPAEVYNSLASGALADYPFINLDNKDRYYYKRVYIGCVRAIDFLMSLPEVDTSKLAVYGGSQGGALAIVTAALHSRIQYVAALYPALSDLTGYLHGRAGGWPHMFAPAQKGAFETTNVLTTASYYDVVNFARMIKIPGWYSWGFNDEICPPTTAYAVYNSITAPKELFITKETGHWLSPMQDKESIRWLLSVLK